MDRGRGTREDAAASDGGGLAFLLHGEKKTHGVA